MKNKKGFTLIELLVVISIIAVLATLALVAVSGVQKQARDIKRKNDLNQYRVALQNYASSNNLNYPGFAASGRIPVDGVTAPRGGNAYLCSSTAGVTYSLMPYLGDVCLLDPKNNTSQLCDNSGNNYVYCYVEDWGGSAGPGATSYFLYAKLETGGWFLVCSNGLSGKVSTVPGTDSTSCPL